MSDKPTQAQLEVMTRITRGRTCKHWFHANTINAMRRREWLIEQPDTERSYNTMIALTPKGRAVLKANADRAVVNHIARILELTAEECVYRRSVHRQFSPRMESIQKGEVKRVCGLIEREVEHLSKLCSFVNGRT